MPKTKRNNRRGLIIMAVMAAVALAGVTMIKVDPVRADKALAARAALTATTGETAPVESPASPVEPTESPGVAPAVVKMISALALVIAAVYGALYLLKRLMGRRGGGAMGVDALTVLQTTYVGQHKAISLVKVGKRAVLVGVTDSQISTLTELDQDETDEILEQTPQTVPSESFSKLLSSTTDKLKSIGLKKKRAALET